METSAKTNHNVTELFVNIGMRGIKAVTVRFVSVRCAKILHRCKTCVSGSTPVGELRTRGVILFLRYWFPPSVTDAEVVFAKPVFSKFSGCSSCSGSKLPISRETTTAAGHIDLNSKKLDDTGLCNGISRRCYCNV